MSSLHLLGRTTSINVRKVLWTLGEIGTPFTHDDDAAMTRTAEFKLLNPNALVPVIEDENGILWESNTICRYLATKHRHNDLLPAEPGPRSKVEMWMDWQSGDLTPAWRYAVMAMVRKDERFNDPAQIAASVSAWNGKMKIFDTHLAAAGSYVTGEKFTLADIVLGLSAHRWFTVSIERPDAPHVKSWLERVRARPAGSPYMTKDYP